MQFLNLKFLQIQHFNMKQNPQNKSQKPPTISQRKDQNRKLTCIIRRIIQEKIISKDKRFTKKTLKASSKLPHLLRLYFRIQSNHVSYQFLKLITMKNYGLAFPNDCKQTIISQKSNGITIWSQFKRIYHLLSSDGIQKQRIIIGKYVDRWAGDIQSDITNQQKQKLAQIVAYVRNNKIYQNSQQYRQKKQWCQKDYIFNEQLYNKKLKPKINKGMKKDQQTFVNFQMKLNQNTFPSRFQETEDKLVKDLAQFKNLSYPCINLQDSISELGINNEEKMSFNHEEKIAQKSVLKQANQESVFGDELPLDQSWSRSMIRQHNDYYLNGLVSQNDDEYEKSQQQIDLLQDVVYLQKNYNT